MKKVIIIIVVIVAVAVVLIVLQRSRQPGIAGVRIVSVQKGTITKAVVATGDIRPLAVAEVKSKVGGVVRTFFVEEGDAVRKGEKLAEIVPSATPEELVNVRERVKTAEYQLENSRRKLKRLEDLSGKDLISDEEIEQAETQLAIDAARYDAAFAELQVLEQGSSRSKTLSSQKVGTATADALSDMTIMSPISGIVLSRNVDEGSSVIAMSSAYGGTSLMTLADVSKMHFEGDVDESDVAKISEDMPAKVFVDAYPDTVFGGILTRISPQGIMADGVVNFRVKADVADQGRLLKTGMSADVQLVIAERTGVLTLPEGGIIYEGDSTFVEKTDGTAEGGARRVAVEVGLSDGIRTEIISGLAEGDQVVMQ